MLACRHLTRPSPQSYEQVWMSRPGSSWRTEDMDPTCQGSPTTHILTISLHHLATASHAPNRFLIDQSLSTTIPCLWPHPWPHPYIMTNTHLFVQVFSCKLKFQHGGVLRHLFCSHLVNTHTHTHTDAHTQMHTHTQTHTHTHTYQYKYVISNM